MNSGRYILGHNSWTDNLQTYSFPTSAAKSLQSCLTLCDPHRRQPTRLPHPWDSPGKNTGVGFHFLLKCMKVKSEREVTQSCPTLCDHTVYSLPGSSLHGILQARILQWIAIHFSGGSFWPRNWTWVCHIAGRFFITWATRKANQWIKGKPGAKIKT